MLDFVYKSTDDNEPNSDIGRQRLGAASHSGCASRDIDENADLVGGSGFIIAGLPEVAGRYEEALRSS